MLKLRRMKKNIIYNLSVIFIIAGMLFFVSCDDDNFLDRYPLDSPSPEVFFVNEASARLAVTAAYRPWTVPYQSYRRDLVLQLDAGTDDVYHRPARAASIQFAEWNFDASHIHPSAYWNMGYQSINHANFAIANIPVLLDKGLSQAQIDPYIGEAHFMRAFSYLFLTTFFGEVPLHDKPRASFEEFEQPRAPLDDIYRQIIGDFTLAREKLPERQPAAYTGSPTRATAAAFLAKAYLYNKNWGDAETAARTAITVAEGSGYHLVNNFLSIFSIDNEANPELLFYITFVENNRDFGNNYSINNLTRANPPQFNHVQGMAGFGYTLPTRDLFDAFENGDPRREYTIFYPGSEWGIYRTDTPFTYSHRTYNGEGVLVTYSRTYNDGDPIEYDYRWSESGMNLRKTRRFMGNVQDAFSCGLDVPVMRMAELYLILAEALAEQGKDEALVWVNKVRARPSVDMPPKTTADGTLRDLVRHERRVELALEGHRLYDLIRWGTVKETFGDGTRVKKHFFSDFLTDMDSKYKNPRLDNYPGDLVLFPIPQDELDRNSKINTNNPGY
jgi:starch-binding outer membrane protein, SusD/RagB family